MSRERRRYKRIDCAISVVLKDRRGNMEMLTANISRHGAFILTDCPRENRELVQLCFKLGDYGDVDVMCMVARSIDKAAAWHDDLPGMGVDFFALSSSAKHRWDEFLLDLERSDTGESPIPREAKDTRELIPASKTAGKGKAAPDKLAREDAAASSTNPLERPTPSVEPPAPRQAVVPRESAATRDLKPAGRPMEKPIRRNHVRHVSCFFVHLEDKHRLREFFTKDISLGGVFLKTTAPDEVRPNVDLILVHPQTKEEFVLDGKVVRIEKEGPPKEWGVGIAFSNIQSDRETALLAFIETGVNFLDGDISSEEERIQQLHQAVEMAIDSADALANLGDALLKEVETDIAIKAYELALIQDHEHIRVHLGLHKAYTMLDETKKAGTHLTTARRLQLEQRKKKE